MFDSFLIYIGRNKGAFIAVLEPFF